jgi:ribonuclease P protein component
MLRDQRLTRAKDFALARRQGKSWSDRLLVLVARPNALDTTRYGFSVGRRVGKAVVRNRVKRRLREVVRPANVRQGWDLVVIARQGASTADYSELERSMKSLLGRARLLDSESK